MSTETVNGFSCVLIGSESLLLQCAEILEEKGHDIRAIASRESTILGWAREREISTVAPGKGLAEALEGLEFDYLLSITHLAIIPDEVLAMPRKGAINFHDGPLPRYGGLYTPVWALMNREERYGITFHEMTAGIDEGDILKQRLFDVAPDETSLTINAKCFSEGIEAFTELVDDLAADTAVRVPQSLAEKTYFGKFDRPEAACLLDWNRSAEDVGALVRALDFGRYENPVGSPKLVNGANGERAILVGSASVVEGDHGAPGTVVDLTDETMTVAASSGAVKLGDFKTVAGLSLTAREAATRLEAVEGQCLELPGETLRERIEDANRAFCRAEAFWARRLRSLESASIPYLRLEGTGGAASSCASVELALPGEHSGDALVSAFALYLLRVSGQETLDVAFRDDSVATAVKGLESFASSRVPLRVIHPADDSTVGAAMDALGSELAKVRKRGSYLREVSARFPEVGGNPELRAGRLLPIAVEQTDDPDGFELDEGVDFALTVTPDGDRVRFVYREGVLDAEGAAALSDQFATFVAGLQPEATLADVSLLSQSERDRQSAWNATAKDYPRNDTIHALFHEQATRTPDAPALSFEGDTLTYAELDARANQLAAHLRELGIGPDRMVGIFVDRSVDMVVSVLGVMKAGGAYIPLDPDYPRHRIAFMIEDSGVSVVLTQSHLRSELPPSDARAIAVDTEWSRISQHSSENVDGGAGPENLAYMIYTSGSTGKPKGVMVEHRNVLNFFAGMDDRVPHEPAGVWLAVTSLSFDISVLELHWTLCRGFHVVLYKDGERSQAEASAEVAADWRPMDFGLFLWGSDGAAVEDKYELMLETARFGDERGFSSISTPERHFHAFGGPYPNPAVTSAAIAAVTENIQIRSGSCVLPLHHPIRVAEEWAVVDNISKGRVALAMAAGWQPDDFVIRPEGFKDAKLRMAEGIETVRKLWRGETVEFENPMGKQVEVSTQPRPVQDELPIWITTAGNVETYEMAGRMNAHVLTHLLGQGVEEVAEKIVAYRKAREEAGLDPAEGKVTLMLHTFVGADDDTVREIVRQPMKDYLSSSVSLVKDYAWSFPAFTRPGGADATPADIDLNSLNEEELDAILEFAFERYFETSGLFGSPETCAAMVARVRKAGVDEIACLVDYGVPTQTVLQSLDALDAVRVAANTKPEGSSSESYSLAAQAERHGVTHMQCTPSMAKMMTMHDEMSAGLGRIQHLMIGGEAFPVSLAADLDGVVGGDVTNMYGPTETTIWSSTQSVVGSPDSISIGHPIANTQFYIVDRNLQPLPAGVPGELLIGGDGVVRGYYERPDLTAERFVADPFRAEEGARLYRTGDLARFQEDGSIDFLGRMDFQVKIRGYRIELGEIETNLGRLAAVRECVVAAREDTPGDLRLVAYVVPEGDAPSHESLRDALREGLPDFMIPSVFAMVDRFPLTPNGKVDRKALPSPDQLKPKTTVEYVEPEGELEQIIAGVWSEVLCVENIGMDDNFFDLGGHSLLVVRVHRQLRDGIDRPLTLTDLYRFTTIRSLCAHLSGEGEGPDLDESRERGESRRKSMMRRRGTRGRGRRGAKK